VKPVLMLVLTLMTISVVAPTGNYNMTIRMQRRERLRRMHFTYNLHATEGDTRRNWPV